MKKPGSKHRPVILSQCIILIIQGPSCTKTELARKSSREKSVFLWESLRWSATWKPHSNLELASKCLPKHIFPRYFQNLIRKSDQGCDHPEFAQNMNLKAKGRLFAPDWAQAEKATEERSVIRSNQFTERKLRGAFLTSLGAKTNIILY